MKDLLVIVPCKDMEYSIRGLLSRQSDLKICKIEFEIEKLTNHDSVVYKTGPEFLRMRQDKYRFGILMFDKHGSGAEQKETPKIMEEIQTRLDSSGWKDRSAVIVIEPELEIWAFNNSLNVAKHLKWDKASFKEWLQSNKWIIGDKTKPDDPKNALKAAWGKQKIQRSSVNYLKIAQLINFQDCQDAAFNKFRETLRQWFPVK